MKRHLFLSLIFTFGAFFGSFAQTISLPPGGGNQQASVTQYIGSIVSVTVDYHSPDVTGPNGEDRTGKIWGQLVPYGMNDLGFGLREPAPWRAGANENTTITFSHDVAVQGKPIPAGTYSLFIEAREDDSWRVYFNSRSDAWGSFFYDPANDVLVVEAEPSESEFTEWLTYEFTDRQATEATLAMKWENIMLPFKITVPELNDLYVATIEEQLYGSAGFNFQNYVAAANFCIQNDVALEKGLEWAEAAVSAPFVGVANFNTLSVKASVLEKLGRTGEAKTVRETAINHPTASVLQLHQYGRQLIAQGEKQEAMRVFQLNAKRYPDTWPINVGLARGYSANGDYKKAIKHAKLALTKAPDTLNKDNLVSIIETLEKGEDIN